MSTDFIAARARKKWRAPFSDEGFVDVTQDDYEKEKNRRPVFPIGSFEDRTINRSERSKVARRSERFLRRLHVGAEDAGLGSEDTGRRTRIAVLDRSEFSRARKAPRPHTRGPGSLCEATSKTVADGTQTRRTGPSPVIPNHFSASGLRVVPERLAGKRLALRCCDACPCRPERLAGKRLALRCMSLPPCPCRPSLPPGHSTGADPPTPLRSTPAGFNR